MIAPYASNLQAEDTAEHENRRILRPRNNKQDTVKETPRFPPEIPRRRVEVSVPTRKSIEEAKLRKQRELEKAVENISEDEVDKLQEKSETIRQPKTDKNPSFVDHSRAFGYKLKSECDAYLEKHPGVAQKWRTEGLTFEQLVTSKVIQEDVRNVLAKHRVAFERPTKSSNMLSNAQSKQEYTTMDDDFSEEQFYVQNVCRTKSGQVYAIQNQFWEASDMPDSLTEIQRKELLARNTQQNNLARERIDTVEEFDRLLSKIRQEAVNEVASESTKTQNGSLQSSQQFNDDIKFSVNRIELPGLPKGAVLVEDPVISAYYNGNNGPFNLGKTQNSRAETANESEDLKTIWPHIAGAGRHECLLDEGSQIVSMSKSKALELGISWDPEKRLPMTSANNTTEYTDGIASNVPFTFGNITLYLQVHILQRSATDILLGRPFKRIARCNTQDNPDGSVVITITDPSSGKQTSMATFSQGTLPPFKRPEIIQPMKSEDTHNGAKVFHRYSRN